MFREKQDLRKFIHGPIEVKASPVHGRGVFATEDIPTHTCIEICPAVAFAKDMLDEWWREQEEKHVLTEHVFHHDKGALGQAIVFGYGSIYNHRIPNNALFRWSEVMAEPAMEFWTVAPIKKGEEIFTRYCTFQSDEWWWIA